MFSMERGIFSKGVRSSSYIWIIIATFGAAVTLVACGGASAQSAGDPERGRELFEDRHRVNCIWCHSLDGSERGFKGPSLQGVSERAGDRVPGLSAEEYLRQSILEPSEYRVEGFNQKMRDYQLVKEEEVDIMFASMLTQEQLDDLVAFLLTQ
jgi:cytochrome c2